ncbi:MAG: hypothetical protein CTY31_06870 [Hyphomicrobium sp.]|nr:MAG: hypothetical protein CTY31_06870 [Hyphomicrobium sp.]
MKRPGGRDLQSRKAAIEKAGIGKTAAQEAISIASIPKRKFDQAVEGANPPTVTDLVQMAEPPPKHNAENGEHAHDVRHKDHGEKIAGSLGRKVLINELLAASAQANLFGGLSGGPGLSDLQ